MRYCANYDLKTHLTSWQGDSATYCPDCGTDLTPQIQCQCGATSYNPTSPLRPKFCTACGTEWTDAYLSRCMSAQLNGMIRGIVEKKALVG